MNCKYYKIEDEHSGYCRFTVLAKNVDKKAARPVRMDDFCEEWKDCGQQYYIRLGWLKARKDKAAPTT